MVKKYHDEGINVDQVQTREEGDLGTVDREIGIALSRRGKARL